MTKKFFWFTVFSVFVILGFCFLQEIIWPAEKNVSSVAFAFISGSPSVSLKANGSAGQISIEPNSSISLTWTSKNAAFCYAYGDWNGGISQSGSKNIPNISSFKRYYIVCGNHSTKNLASASVLVDASSSPAPPPGTFSVELQAIPCSGEAPFNPTLRATLHGTILDAFGFGLDCTNDGVWDQWVGQVPTDKVVVSNFCNYPSPGTYTALAMFETEGLDGTFLIDEDTVEIIVTSSFPPDPDPGPAPETLSVKLQAIPSSGEAPFFPDLKATISGSAGGEWGYKFDCENDGIWDQSGDNLSELTTTVILQRDCYYSASGTYKAKVQVERESLTAEDTVIIRVSSAPSPPPAETLGVKLRVVPSSGDGPLNNVDLIAEVEGAGSELVSYKFDCENDGIWDHLVPDSSKRAFLRAADICDYPLPGTYRASVKVEIGSVSAGTFQAADDSVIITVSEHIEPSISGDLDGDGKVDDNDMDFFFNNINSLKSDVNSDGVVNGFDFWELREIIKQS